MKEQKKFDWFNKYDDFFMNFLRNNFTSVNLSHSFTHIKIR